MLLIADSGSTKIDWCFIYGKDKLSYFRSEGLNPFNASEQTIRREVEKNILPHVVTNKKLKMYFYGSGCDSQRKKKEMTDIFQPFLPLAEIHIHGDLLGAARATCLREKGIAAILGTGSNSCIYDGENIVENLPSLGYVLCDEGAGTNIGKIVLRNYLRGQMPEHLADEFREEYPGDEADFLDRLYRGEKPNLFIASFAEFAIKRKYDLYCRRIIAEAFHNFFIMQVSQYTDYKKYPVNVVGSVGFFAQDVFREVAEQYDIKTGKFIQSPLEELVKYHLSLK